MQDDWGCRNLVSASSRKKKERKKERKKETKEGEKVNMVTLFINLSSSIIVHSFFKRKLFWFFQYSSYSYEVWEWWIPWSNVIEITERRGVFIELISKELQCLLSMAWTIFQSFLLWRASQAMAEKLFLAVDVRRNNTVYSRLTLQLACSVDGW